MQWTDVLYLYPKHWYHVYYLAFCLYGGQGVLYANVKKVWEYD